MSSWNYEVFQEKLGNKTQYGLVFGRPCSGKTELSKQISNDMGYQIIDMKAINEECKNRINAEREAKGEDPLEGDPPIAESEAVVNKMMQDTSKKFIFDGFKHEKVTDFINWLNQFGGPNFVLGLTADEAAIAPRWVNKYNEDADLDDEKKEAVKEEAKVADKVFEEVKVAYEPLGARVNIIQVDTSTSLETTKAQLKANFAPKVILVNHEKNLPVDNVCSNLAIKHNLIYISVYQLIKEHVETNSEWGKKLMATKKPKFLNIKCRAKDEFKELEFSPAHFEQSLVMELLKETIAKLQINQKYVIIEGMCNTNKFFE